VIGRRVVPMGIEKGTLLGRIDPSIRVPVTEAVRKNLIHDLVLEPAGDAKGFGNCNLKGGWLGPVKDPLSSQVVFTVSQIIVFPLLVDDEIVPHMAGFFRHHGAEFMELIRNPLHAIDFLLILDP
jgi:hypothetical protein